MSYPQTVASEAVLGGQNFWRLRTLLSSPGDMYESDASALAFAIGPDSDIANVLINYFDPLAGAASMNELVISPDRAMTGLISARNEVPYPLRLSGNRPGKILISSADVYDESFQPSTFVGGDDRMILNPPTLDVIQYFSAPPSLIPERSDKNYFYKGFVAPEWNFIVIPFYGRKYAYISLQNNDSAASADWQVLGVTYSITTDPKKHIEKQLQTVATVAANGGFDDLVVKASTSGVFDALCLGINYTPTTDLELAVNVRVSDNEV